MFLDNILLIFTKLTLSDHYEWAISADSTETELYIAELSKYLHLPIFSHQSAIDGSFHCLLQICSGEETHRPSAQFIKNEIDDNHQVIVKKYYIKNTSIAIDHIRELWKITSYIGRSTEDRGGMLLHSALITNENTGVLLMGPSGIGKTTASLRVKVPWRVMSDDLAMVIKSDEGYYHVHPWPSWFHLHTHKAFTNWYIERSYILKGLYFIYQSEHDLCTPVGSGEATAHLLQAVDQVSYYSRRTRGREQQLR